MRIVMRSCQPLHAKVVMNGLNVSLIPVQRNDCVLKGDTRTSKETINQTNHPLSTHGIIKGVWFGRGELKIEGTVFCGSSI